MQIIKRLIGFVLFFLGVLILILPFILVVILFGINKANVIMSTVMKCPMNLFFDGMGNDLLETHLKIYREEKND